MTIVLTPQLCYCPHPTTFHMMAWVNTRFHVEKLPIFPQMTACHYCIRMFVKVESQCFRTVLVHTLSYII